MIFSYNDVVNRTGFYRCKKIGEMELVGKNLEGLNIFFTDETLIYD